MTEPSADTVRLLKPTATYRKMGLVVVAGLALLGVLGWAASSARNVAAVTEGYELLSLTQGSVKEVVVKPGQDVQKGDVLVLLDDTAEQKELADARIELERVAAETEGAGIAVAMPPAMAGLGGRIIQTGPMRGITGPMPSIPKSKDDGKVGTLPPVTGAGDAEPPGAKFNFASEIAALEFQLEENKTAIIDGTQKADDAATLVSESEKNLQVARLIADQRKKQAEKMRMLLGEGVVSQVETSRSEALYASAEGGYLAAVKQVEELKAARDARLDEVAKAKTTVATLEKQIVNSKSLALKAASAPKPVDVAANPTFVAPRREVIKPAYVKSEPAPAVPAKVTVDKGAKREMEGLMSTAKARFDKAEQALEGRRVVAPQAGTVTRVLVTVGDVIKPGTSVVVIRFSPIN